MNIDPLPQTYKGDVNSALGENSKEPSPNKVFPAIIKKNGYELYSNITWPSPKTLTAETLLETSTQNPYYPLLQFPYLALPY